MKKFCVIFMLVLLAATAGFLTAAGNPQGGYLIWHQAGGHIQQITVDQPGCIEHLSSHKGDVELSPVLGGSCGFEPIGPQL